MRMETSPESAGQAATRKYGGYGLFGRIALGLVVGVLVSGPHFDDWPALTSLALVLACAAVGALLGWVSLGIASAGVASGAVWGVGHVEGWNWSGSSDSGHPGGGDGSDVS